MRYRKLGDFGVKVSEISLGSWLTYGGSVEDERAIACVHRAFELGVNFFDTANVYRRGAAEEVTGRALKGIPRNDYFLATKVYFPMGDGPNDRGLSRKHIMEQCHASLKRLGTDYVDLYQLHRHDPLTPLDETLEALDTVVRSGKARYVGVSNWPAHKVARALGRSELKNIVRIASVQPRYNMLFRGYERDLLPFCEEEGIAVIPYNPMAGGMLSGKYDAKAAPPEGSRFQLGSAGARYQERYWHAREFETIEALRPIAAEAGMNMATMAMRWVISNPAITSPIIGASKPEQLADNLVAAEQGALPKDLKKKLDDVTREWRAVDAER